jgi:hypothetical protein
MRAIESWPTSGVLEDNRGGIVIEALDGVLGFPGTSHCMTGVAVVIVERKAIKPV